MEKGFYHPSVGYWQTTNEPSDETRSQYPQGTVEVALKPGYGYEYDGSAWVAPSAEWLYEVATKEVRSLRDWKLQNEVDVVVSNPLRWGGMTAEQQGAWASYRTALLDITNQAGFPHEVVWPIKPV